MGDRRVPGEAAQVSEAPVDGPVAARVMEDRPVAVEAVDPVGEMVTAALVAVTGATTVAAKMVGGAVPTDDRSATTEAGRPAAATSSRRSGVTTSTNR